METIIRNINDPSWWFTGLFFVLLAYLLPKLFRFVNNIPVHTKGLQRKLILKKLIKIKAIRFDNTKVIIEAIKAYALLVVFAMSAIVAVFYYLTEPSYLFESSENEIIKKFVILLVSSPVFIAEVVYLRQHFFVRTLLVSRDRISITRRCSWQ